MVWLRPMFHKQIFESFLFYPHHEDGWYGGQKSVGSNINDEKFMQSVKIAVSQQNCNWSTHLNEMKQMIGLIIYGVAFSLGWFNFWLWVGFIIYISIRLAYE